MISESRELLWDEIFGHFFNTLCMSSLSVVDHAASLVCFKIDSPPGYGIEEFPRPKFWNGPRDTRNTASDVKFYADYENSIIFRGISERTGRKTDFQSFFDCAENFIQT